MHLIIGLGPIGGNIGARLAEPGRKVYGNDFNEERVREWSEETDSPAGRDLTALDWATVESIHIAVRTWDYCAANSVRSPPRSSTTRPKRHPAGACAAGL